MRRVLCLWLSLALLLALAVPAFASETGEAPAPAAETPAADPAPSAPPAAEPPVTTPPATNPPAPTECTHAWDNGAVLAYPGCKTPGSIKYTCTLCGATKNGELAATGTHVWAGWQNVDGSNHKRSCTDCGVEETAGHTWNLGQVDKQPTCKDTGIKSYTCTGCGTRKEETMPVSTTHTMGDWALTETTHSRSCIHCGHSESGAHAWDGGTVSVPPTCAEEGGFIHLCTTCGGALIEVIPKLTTHTWDNDCDTDCNVCGLTRETEHKYATIWSKNSKGHWHGCTICGDQKDFGKHYPGPAATEEKAQICLTCGYTLTAKLNHTHNYGKTLSSDETGHWIACAGCEEQKDFAEHVYDDPCDPDCNDCGYVTPTAHNYDGGWFYDAGGHWADCTLCGESCDKAEHEPGEEATEDTPQLCRICSYEMAPALEAHVHEFAQQWQSDAEVHWQACDCGELSEAEPHTWDEGEEGPEDSVLYTCTICGVQKSEGKVPAAEESGFAWWKVLFFITIACAIACTVVLVIILKKGSKGKYRK
ncbi:MAG: hypothetical protein IJO21_00940 [Oscillospiraceae bacterium]|nr:hypothetical protein [Oscillospiraceae bacterium]MBQ7129599.1 hypothetical protein [Oscillospiraceae bacterium]